MNDKMLHDDVREEVKDLTLRVTFEFLSEPLSQTFAVKGEPLPQWVQDPLKTAELPTQKTVRNILDAAVVYDPECDEIYQSLLRHLTQLRILPMRPDRLHDISDDLCELGHCYGASNILKAGTILYPDDIGLHNRAASVNIALERYKDAQSSLKKARALDSKNPDTIMNYGLLYYQTERFDAAAKYFFQATELEPQNPQIYYNLASCYVQSRNWKKTIQPLLKAIRIAPNYYDAHLQLAGAYLEIGHLSLARKHLDYADNVSMNLNDEDVDYITLLRITLDTATQDAQSKAAPNTPPAP